MRPNRVHTTHYAGPQWAVHRRKLMAGYALAAGNASPGRVQWHAEVCSAPPCGCDVRSFGSCEPTITSADSALITPRVAAWRAVQTGKSDCVFADRFGSGQSPQPSAWFVSGTALPGRSSAKGLGPTRSWQCLQRGQGRTPWSRLFAVIHATWRP